MPRTTCILLLAMTAVQPGCATPDPTPDPMHTSHDTELSTRLRAISRAGPIVVGHRGAGALYPENTLPSFVGGLDAGAQVIELDVRQTSDGVLVCVHDQTVDRTTDGARQFGRDQVAIATLRAGELETLDAGAWKGPEYANVRIPTLQQALATVQPRGVTMIEHKDGAAERFVALLEANGWTDEVLVQSFDWEWIAAVRRLAPTLTLGALGSGKLTPERLSQLESLQVSMVHWAADHLRIEDMEALQARGYLVCVFTLNSDIELLGGIATEVDAITTDLPGRLRELLAREH